MDEKARQAQLDALNTVTAAVAEFVKRNRPRTMDSMLIRCARDIIEDIFGHTVEKVRDKYPGLSFESIATVYDKEIEEGYVYVNWKH